jgi:hypothetical protein
MPAVTTDLRVQAGTQSVWTTGVTPTVALRGVTGFKIKPDQQIDILSDMLLNYSGGDTPVVARNGGGEAVTADGEGIGALAIFNEFVPDTWQTSVEGAEMARKDYERIFGVDLSGYTNICGFSSKQPIENMEQYSIRTPEVDHSNDHQYEMLNRAVMEFADSAIQKSFLDGSIVINKGGPGSLPYIENPFLLTDETGDMMLYWRDDMNKSGFSYMYIKNSPGVFLPVYRDASATAENGIELTSGVMSPVDFNGIPAYQDENGSIAGHPSNELPADATNWYLSVVDGKFTVTQAPQK